ncbi:MAG: C4-dicarboxylic acid transporter DauA [Gemmatimonadaceae bacterium]|nr:C4-dicarboxylic acid transporter DauA [Gemmatimonadaceae bacterium]
MRRDVGLGGLPFGYSVRVGAIERATTDMLVPKSFTTLRTYDRKQFTADLTAGVIVGVVALPLAIAFAIASGVTPERGLYTAIVAGFLISAFGGSRVQIGGPTGAFVVIVYGIVQRYGLAGLTAATLMAGVMLILMGVARLGQVIKFIPSPVVTGFTSGIAVVIASSQVRDMLGLELDTVPANFLERLYALGGALPTTSLPAIGVGMSALLIITLWPRVSRRVPGPFVALIVTTAIVWLFKLPVETVGSKFGTLPSSLPHPVLPHLSLDDATRLVGPAFSIAMLGAIESLLSAVVADGMIGSRHRSNMELVAQGIANIGSATFGGIPATGAIARTATNVKNGGRTPIAGIVHSIVLLVITLFVGQLAALIPMATLAAILFVVSYHMSEWRVFVDELRGPRADAAVLITAFLLTVLVDLTVAIEVGMVLASFLFMHRMAEVTNVSALTRAVREGDGDDRGSDLAGRRIPQGVEVYEISGAFFFGAAETFKDTLATVAKKPKVLIIRMRDVSFLDSTGLRALRDVVRRGQRDRTLVLVAEIHAQPLLVVERSPLFQELGEQRIFTSLDDALDHAELHLAVRIPTPLATPVGGPAEQPQR